MAAEVIGTDVSGYEVLTEAMKDLLNSFPGLLSGETVKFEDIGIESGIIFSNNSGALVYSEKVYVDGTVVQECRYPFYLVYRAASSAREGQKMSIFEFLDAFGKWLCKEVAVIDDVKYKLAVYPTLPTGREIKKITRNNVYGTEPQEGGIQDWVLPVTVQYTNIFKP